MSGGKFLLPYFPAFALYERYKVEVRLAADFSSEGFFIFRQIDCDVKLYFRTGSA